jgi:outer membrane protein assembly factor BamB
LLIPPWKISHRFANAIANSPGTVKDAAGTGMQCFMKYFSRPLIHSALLCALATPVLAASTDWPQWRGPSRDGLSTETGLLKQWPAGGPPMVWKATGLGSGYATVAVAGNGIFTMGDKGESSYAMALNRADGKTLWATRVGRGGAPGWGGFEGPRSTPAVDGNLVFAIGQWGELVSLDTATGKQVWRKDLTQDFGGSRPEWGFAESPLIDGDKVILTPGGAKGTVVALDKKTGETIWQSKEFTDSAQYASLIMAEIGGARQYIQLTDASVAGLSAGEGKLLWRAKRQGSTAVIPTPIYQDNSVYVTSGYGVGCNLFQITPGSGKFLVREVYANKVMANHHGGVVRVGDYVYGHSEGKGWTCQELKSGKSVWQEKGKLGKGSIAYADGRFYLRAEDGKGTVALIEATPAGYREKGRFDPPNRSDKNSWAHPVIAGSKLYLRDQDILLCYDLKAK